MNNLDNHQLALEFDKVLINLSKYANSSLGKKKCLNVEFYNNKSQIEYELILTTEAKKIIDNTSCYLPFGDILDINELFKTNKITSKEIVELAKNLKYARETKNFIQKNNKSNLAEITANFYINKEFEDYIFNIFDNEYNLKDNASDKLKSLRNSYKDNKENLKNSINLLLQNPSFVQNLQDTVVSTRDSRPVFQVKASCKNKVPGIIHDISSTNLTYFIEPSSLVPQTNKLKQIEIEIKAEIERILDELCQKFKEIKKELVDNQNLLVKLDFIFAKARYAIHLCATEPEITDKKIIDIQSMAHPLLLEVKDEVIRNDFILGKNYNCLLITGSNTGGKTVALKTAGVIV